MKKSLSIVLALLLLLTACQTVPDDDQSLASTPSSSSSVTPPPSSSVVPTTQPTATTQPSAPPATPPTAPPATYLPAPPVSLPELPPVPDTHYRSGFITRDWDDSWNPYFCWRLSDTRETTIICNEWVPAFDGYGNHIYFVKESEPTKIYVTAKGDFQNHQLYYESPYGNITYINFESGVEGYLQFIADEQRFYILNLSTGESTFLMEQYYMECAGIAYWNGHMLWFEGRPTADSRMGQYDYDPVTGKSTYRKDQL